MRILLLVMLTLLFSGGAQAVTRTVNAGGGTFNIEIIDPPSKLLYAPVPNRPPLQQLEEILGSIHYSSQQPNSRISTASTRQLGELDQVHVEITVIPVLGILRQENATASTLPFRFETLLERGENVPIRLSSNRKLVCAGTGSETLLVQIRLRGYEVTFPATATDNVFTHFDPVSTIPLAVTCVGPYDYPGRIVQAYEPVGEDIDFNSDLEIILIPPPPTRVGESIKVIGLLSYVRQRPTSGGSAFTASTMEGINAAGHVYFKERSLADSPVTPMVEKPFTVSRLSAPGEMRAIDMGSFTCVRSGTGNLSWFFDAGSVTAHDNATPNTRFEVPIVPWGTVEVPFECVFTAASSIQKTLVVHGAVLDVTLNHQDDIVADRQPHPITGTVTYREQAPGTRLDALNTQNAINFENQPLAVGASRQFQSSMTCAGTARQEHRVTLNIGHTQKTVWFPSGASENGLMGAIPLEVAVPVTCRNREFWGRVNTRSSVGDHTVSNMKVHMRLEGRTYFTSTDSDGYFDFAEAGAALQYDDNSQASLRLIFADGFGPDPQQFRLLDHASGDTAYLETAAAPVANFPRRYVIGDETMAWSAAPNIPGAFDNNHDKLKNFGTTFALFSYATRFVNRRMSLNLISPGVGPLTVSMYSPGLLFPGSNQPLSYAAAAENKIYLTEWSSGVHGRLGPASTMMHELGHMVMWHSRIAARSNFPQPSNKEIYHLGRANHSTTSSWVEGFADWFAALIFTEYRAPLQSSSGYTPGDYDFMPGIRYELNYPRKPWFDWGRDEEWALAGVLWDIYDAPAFYNMGQDRDGPNDEATVPLWRLWPMLNQASLKDFKNVYDALGPLALHYSDWLAKQNQIFKEHGVFVDTNGNERHDAGEEIGRSAWGGLFMTLWDIDSSGNSDGYWPNEHFAPGTLGVIPAPAAAATRLVAAAANAAGYYTSSNLHSDDLGLLDENADPANLELKEIFLIHPHLTRRSTLVPSDRYLNYMTVDAGGAPVPQADLRIHYEYAPPHHIRNFALDARMPGQGSIPLLVPPGGRLRIEMFAGSHVSSELVVDQQTADANSLRLGNQGDAQFQIPASAAEIAQALAATPAPGTSPPATPGAPGTPGSTPPGPAPGPGIPVALIAVAVLILILIALFIILRRP